jgi:serine/threonine protein kinase
MTGVRGSGSGPADILSSGIVKLTDFIKGQELGFGNFGHVYLGTERRTGRKVPMKEVNPYKDSREQKFFIRELQILHGNNHPATLCLIGYFPPTATNGGVLITDFMPNGTLDKYRRGLRSIGWNATTQSKVIFGVAAAMAHCHSRGIIHRDLKPDNIFLSEALEPVVADFGISRRCSPWGTWTAGTDEYMAPETKDDVCDFPVDVFAFAVTVHQMFVVGFPQWDDGKPAARPGDGYSKRICSGARPTKPPKMPDCIWEIVTRCWKQAPAERPTFWQLINEWKGARSYVVPGADPAQLLRYEERVFRPCGQPKLPACHEVLPLDSEAARVFSRQVENLLRTNI